MKDRNVQVYGKPHPTPTSTLVTSLTKNVRPWDSDPLRR